MTSKTQQTRKGYNLFRFISTSFCHRCFISRATFIYAWICTKIVHDLFR